MWFCRFWVFASFSEVNIKINVCFIFFWAKQAEIPAKMSTFAESTTKWNQI